ncbi:MAG: hypothetical protein JJ900_08835 [Rhodospirillales bacterium]|nr:hypothetical protein [Rhodospirillales bacterium]MBO6786944.1 hypothetical protein [Rhodospirillales bacterium]
MRTIARALIAAALVTGATLHGAAAENTGAIGTSATAPGMVPQNAIHPDVAAATPPATQVTSPTGLPPVPGVINADPAKPIAYQDAKRGFMLVAPPGSRFQERADAEQISIQSRKGYAVNIQTGDANPAMTTPEMFHKLEVRYLGDGKPWARKVDESEEIVAGMPAGVAVYEAGSTRTKVVVARGANTDFVMMFFAPISHFEKLSTEFEWILASFRPAPGEKPAEPVQIAGKQDPQAVEPPLRAQTAPDANPAGRPKPVEQASAPDVLIFSEAGYGYRIEYPAAWQLEKLSAFTNAISGPQGTPAYDAIVSLQNVKPAGDGDVARIALDNLKANLSQQARAVQFVGEKPVTYAKYGLTLQGHQFVASYDHQGQRFRKWALVIPRPEGGIAHIWSYTAPATQFDTYRPVAEKILNSLKIDG